MDTKYIRELNHNYLVMIPPKEAIKESYETEILRLNKIPGLADFDIRYYNEQQMFYYEISSKQSIANLYGSSEMNFAEISALIKGIYSMLLSIEEYLININHIIFDPDYIFFEIEKKEITFICYPEYDKNSKHSFSELSEYLLNKVNHKDEKAVLLSYKIYKNTRNENFIMDEIINYLQEFTEERFEETMIINAIGQKEYDNHEILTENKNDDKNEFESEMSMKKNNRNANKTNEKEDGKTNEKDDWQEQFAQYSEQEEIKKDKGIYEKARNVIEKNKNEFYLLVFVFMLTAIFIGVIIMWYVRIIEISILQLIKVNGVLLILIVGFMLSIYISKSRKKSKSIEEQYELTNKKMKESEYIEQQDEKVIISDFLVGNDYYSKQEQTMGNSNTILISSEPEFIKSGYLTRESEGNHIKYLLDHFPYTIGKISGNVNLEIEDSSVSRIHAKFLKKGETLFLEDLNSLNGTYKNGIKLVEKEAVIVESGDEIAFAKINFTYH